jgi:hypothetical protein
MVLYLKELQGSVNKALAREKKQYHPRCIITIFTRSCYYSPPRHTTGPGRKFFFIHLRRFIALRRSFIALRRPFIHLRNFFHPSEILTVQ